MSVTVRLKGLNHSTKKLADGRRVTYWYAWRGGPKLPGKPGEPQFLQAYVEAHKQRKVPPGDTLAALVGRYRGSPEFQRNAYSTKQQWNRWLDRIALGELGGYSFAALSDPDVAADILEWRDQWADRPRTADYAMQVLSRVLSWGMARRLVKLNAAEGVGRLYSADRAEVVWTDAEIAAYRAWAPSSEVGFIVPLACLTGLRREDLSRLTWADVGELYAAKITSKSRGRKTAVIPILPETRTLLAEIRALQSHCDDNATVLQNTRSKPWTPSGLTHAVAAFKGKRLHDCRGTFATRLRLAGLKASEIADAMGWEEKRVERLLSVYVDRERIVKELSNRISNRRS